MSDRPRTFHLQRYTDVTGISGVGRVADGVLWTDGSVTDFHSTLDVLRLCQAHREIVELHMVCQADYVLVEKLLAKADGFPSEKATLRQTSAIALARLQLSDHYLKIISRGYGITLDPPAGSPREGR